MENYIATTEAFLDFDQTKLKSGSQLMESNRNLGVFLLILIVLRQCNFGPWQIVNFAFRTVCTQTISRSCRRISFFLLLVSQYEVLDALIFRQIWHFLVIH